MTTTAIFAEILIVGLEAMVWISLLVLTALDLKSVPLDVLKGWEAMATVLALAAAYVLGVVVDRLADDLRFVVDRKFPGRPVDRLAEITTMRLVVMREGGDLSRFLDYQRSRMRLARATVFNLIVSIPLALLFLGERRQLGWETGSMVALLFIAAYITLRAYQKLEFAYISRLSEAHKLLTNLDEDIDIAAAIPYRIVEGNVQFRLVETSGTEPKYWTFPKGHRNRDRDESLPEAAAREAREEAGVEGRIDPRRLTKFRYPNNLDPKNPDWVAAYLLKYQRDAKPSPGDRQRKRDWVTVDDACRFLAEPPREPEYAQGMQDVVKLAARKVAHDE